MGKPIEEVTIVGGGTAGWLAALILNTDLRQDPAHATVKRIRLIESPNIPTVGVGEATVPGMPRTLRMAGISEREFFRKCNASFKLGVVFDNWNVDTGGRPIAYVNPFEPAPTIRGRSSAIYYAKYGAGDLDYVQSFTPVIDVWKNALGPRKIGGKDYETYLNFAYHLDAGLFSRMIRDICIEKGVIHVLDDVVDVEQDDCGHISAVHLKEGGRQPTELVIDCSGFRGLIINQVLKEPFVSYGRYLANDRAMAVQIPHKPGAKIEPVTKSTAIGAGWCWRVPLFNRIGTGYVFSSAHRTDDEARAEFLRHTGPDHADAEPRVISMRVGRNRNAWVKNCISVGLSGGFIEPLESTAIHTIEMSIRALVDNFPDSDFADPLRNRYNRMLGDLYDEIRDFICLHYTLGNRTDDQYWIDARTDLEVPDSLAENLEIWQHRVVDKRDLRSTEIFGHDTYNAVLLGKQVYKTIYPKAVLNPGIELDPEKWRSLVARKRLEAEKFVKIAPDHRRLLQDLRGELDPGPVAAPRATVPLPGLGAPLGAKITLPKKPPPAPSDDPSLL